MVNKLVVFIFLLMVGGVVNANSQEGTIHTIHSNTNSRLVHVYLDGKPQFDGGVTCSSNYWTGNSMDDLDFKNFVLPILLTAQAASKKVVISVNGCNGSYPKIFGVDLVPRK